MHAVTRSCLAVLVAVLAVMAAAPVAGAQTEDDETDNIVVVTGRAEVREGETVDNVVIADGPVVVDGTVRDVLVAVHGDVLVRGTAEDVFALDGRVVVADSGLIQGDVMSRHRPVVEGDGRIDGSWERWNPTAWRRATTIATRIALWIAFTISTLILGLVLGLLAPRAAAAVGEAARGGVGPVIGWGLLLTIGLPVVAVLAMVTLVGLPLGLGLLLALGLVYGIGYTAGAWVLGRTVARGAQPIVAFLAGWGILRVVAIVPILGGLTWFAAVVVGLGAIAVAGYRARGRATAESDAVPVASPPPAAPPVAEAGDVPGEP